MFGKSIVHAGQNVGPWVGRACADEKVPIFLKQFFGIAAAHFAVVPCLTLQLFLCAEGQRPHKEGAGVVHRSCLLKVGHLSLGLYLGQWLRLGLNGLLKGLCCMRKNKLVSIQDYIAKDSKHLFGCMIMLSTS